MKKSLLWYVSLPIRLLFLVWHRRPSGRGTSDPGLPDIMGLVEFDAAYPNAPEDLRTTFYTAVQAHLSGNSPGAQIGYARVLDIVPNEPITLHNLKLLE
jgi:hypothetical protein